MVRPETLDGIFNAKLIGERLQTHLKLGVLVLQLVPSHFGFIQLSQL